MLRMIGRATRTQGSLRIIHLFVRPVFLAPLALSPLDQALRELVRVEMIVLDLIKGKIILQVEDTSKTSAAADAIVRAIAALV